MAAAKKDPSPAHLEAAMKASDEFLELADHEAGKVNDVVLNDRAPVPVEVHLAQVMGMFPLLVSIAERASIAPEDRALALHTAAQMYTADKFGAERLPGGLDDWESDPDAPDVVATAAIELMGKANREDTLPTLMRVAIAANSHDVRADAALTAIAGLIDGRSCVQALALFQGTPVAEKRALANAAFCEAVRDNCSANLEPVLALAFGKDEAVRPFALSCLAHCTLPDDASNDARRASLADKLRPLIDPKSPPDALAQAIMACASLQLSPVADQIIALGATIDTLALPLDVNGDFLARTLGQRFIMLQTEASKALTAHLVASLGAALTAPETRGVAVKSLQLITNSAVPGLRTALDQLAAIGDQSSIACLKILLSKAYNRDDFATNCGDDAGAWQRALASEHLISDRVNELKAWYKENSKYHIVSDGTARLRQSANYLEKATADTTKWLNDATWLPPLGFTHGEIDSFHRDLNQLKGDVKRGLAGSQQHSGDAGGGTDADAPAAAAPAPAPDAPPQP